jgi:S-adenosylmethionine:tRNA ribosyltransferase-isomerase
MNISDYDYVLPAGFIASEPVYPRDACKLMVLRKNSYKFETRNFYDLVDLLNEGDVLVFNDSKVIPARILFEHNNKKIEIFLTKQQKNGYWLCIGKPGKMLKKGAEFDINDSLKVEVIEIMDDGQRMVRFNLSGHKFDRALLCAGTTPLPPYIKNSMSKPDDYQTIYAKVDGSIAAPTAGLHFTKELMEKLHNKGVQFEFVTLHVGLGTFLPVKAEKVDEHKMHSEFYELYADTAKRLNAAKKEGRRIIAVGTTTVRVLESCYNGEITAGRGETDIFIYPGYKWRCVEGLITNFHLPKSTLLLLVSAFAGIETVKEAYKEAISKQYRFYSYGDAMFIT